ncbi:MAG: patatin-like phospholipase family protein [Candidatus Promineifilaceae bacterium]
MVCDLVFEGGGAKGIAFIGAYAALEAADIRPKRLLGSSAGAIFATLITAGYSAEQLYSTFTDRTDTGASQLAVFADVPDRFSAEMLANSSWAAVLKAIDVPAIPESVEQRVDQILLRGVTALPAVRQLFSLIEAGGIYSGDAFLVWMRQQLDNMDGLGSATLAEMYEHTELELSITAADVTDKRLMVLNHRTAPNLPVAMAVRMSMSAPFYWQEVIWEDAWGLYRGRNVSEHAIVDGGVLANFPVELFLSTTPFVVDIMGAPNDRLIALLLDDDTPVAGQPSQIGRKPTPSRLLNRSLALLDMMLQASTKDVLEAYNDKVIRLPAGGYQAFDFDLDAERIHALVEAAQEAATAFLAIAPAHEQSGLRDARDTYYVDSIAARLLGAEIWNKEKTHPFALS